MADYLARMHRATFAPRGADRIAVNQVSLTIDRKPTLIVGENGAGKTTLFKLISGTERPTSGEVQTNCKILYLPQKFIGISKFTTVDYIRYVAWVWSSRMINQCEAMEWLDYLGIAKSAKTNCGKLSSGQQSRLALATALASSAELILLDEPSAALDPIGRSTLQDIYKKVTALNIGLVVASHDVMDLNSFFQRLVVMNEGSILFVGSPHSFLHDNHSDQAVVKLANAFKKLKEI